MIKQYSNEAYQEQIGETISFMKKTFRSQISNLSGPYAHDYISYMENVLIKLGENSYNCTSVNNTTQDKVKKTQHLRLKRSSYTYKKTMLKALNDSISLGSHTISEKKVKSQTLHVVSETLHYASIVILGLFVLEVGLKVFCVGCKFFKAKFEVVDAVVIVTSFVADVIIVNVGSQEISVMIIFLLWRIVRVINGLLMHEKQRDEFRIALQKKARRVSEMKVEQMTIQNEMQEKHIMALEECSREAGVPEMIIKRCRPKYIQYTKDQTNNPLKSIAAMTTGFMGGLVGAQHSNKDINRFAASYSPSCTPRNRSPQLNKKSRASSPSWGDIIDSNNVINQNIHSNNPNLKHQFAVNWSSSINSVFDNKNEDSDGDYNGNVVKFYLSPLNSDKPINNCLENIHSPYKNFTNQTIDSPYIEDISDCASSHFSISSTDRIGYNIIYRCSHSGSDTTLLAKDIENFDSLTRSFDYV